MFLRALTLPLAAVLALTLSGCGERECTHCPSGAAPKECCVKAKAEGKTCAMCTDAHACCKEAAAKGVACTKCAPATAPATR